MSTAKHTPGPWRVGTAGPNGCYTIGTERGLMTAMVAHSIYMADQKEQAEADARLIAAAPDMLAALIDLADTAAEAWGDKRPCVAYAREVIAKATAPAKEPA